MDHTEHLPCLSFTVNSPCQRLSFLTDLPQGCRHRAHACPSLGQERDAPFLKASKAFLGVPWGLRASTPQLSPLQATGRSVQYLLPSQLQLLPNPLRPICS